MWLFYVLREDFYKVVWRPQIQIKNMMYMRNMRRVKARDVSEKTRKGGPPPESVN